MGAVEQNTRELRCGEVKSYAPTLQYALGVLTGELIHVRHHVVSGKDSLATRSERDPAVASLLTALRLLEQTAATSRFSVPTLLSLASYADTLEPTTIAGDLMRRAYACLVAGSVPPSESTQWGATSAEIVEQWNPDAVRWNQISAIVDFLSLRHKVEVVYSCHGWRSVDCNIRV